MGNDIEVDMGKLKYLKIFHVIILTQRLVASHMSINIDFDLTVNVIIVILFPIISYTMIAPIVEMFIIKTAR